METKSSSNATELPQSSRLICKMGQETFEKAQWPLAQADAESVLLALVEF